MEHLRSQNSSLGLWLLDNPHAIHLFHREVQHSCFLQSCFLSSKHPWEDTDRLIQLLLTKFGFISHQTIDGLLDLFQEYVAVDKYQLLDKLYPEYHDKIWYVR